MSDGFDRLCAISIFAPLFCPPSLLRDFKHLQTRPTRLEAPETRGTLVSFTSRFVADDFVLRSVPRGREDVRNGFFEASEHPGGA